MIENRYHIRIELELHAVTCPGVWLCPNGYVEVTIKTLEHVLKSEPFEPKFPIIIHKKFTVEGYFKNIDKIVDVEQTLANETIEISLWQKSHRLAYFTGEIGQILYQQHNPNENWSYGVDSQIYLRPSHNFPGVLNPKVHLTTRVFVKDNYLEGAGKFSGDFVNVPLYLPCRSKQYSESHQKRHENVKPRRGHPVCHASSDYSSDKLKKIYRSKSESGLNTSDMCDNCIEILENSISHGNPIRKPKKHHRSKSKSARNSNSSSSNDSTYVLRQCSCDKDDDGSYPGHNKECSICELYKSTFRSNK